MNEKTIKQISASILTSYINLFYLEEVSRTNFFKHTAKKNLKRTLEDLKDIEYKYFNKIDELDINEITDKLTSNQITFIDYLLNDFEFMDFTKIQELCLAFKFDPKRISGISNQILIKNGAKK